MVESIVPAANLFGGSANRRTSGELRERDENRLRWRRRNDAANSSKSTVDRAAPMTNHAETLALARLLRQKARVGLLTPRLGQRAFSSSRNRSNNGSMRLFASRAACQHRVTAAGPYRLFTGFPESPLRAGMPNRTKDHLVPLWTFPILIGPGSSVKPASKVECAPGQTPNSARSNAIVPRTISDIMRPGKFRAGLRPEPIRMDGVRSVFAAFNHASVIRTENSNIVQPNDIRNADSVLPRSISQARAGVLAPSAPGISPDPGFRAAACRCQPRIAAKKYCDRSGR